MCGIVGILSSSGINAAELIRMSDALTHRGPDGYGYLFGSAASGMKTYLNHAPETQDWDAAVGLAHRRLSILDLSDVALQPMCDEAGSAAIVFNGEIYNYQEIRIRLAEKGHRFHSTSDTEVLLKAYLEWGEAIFNEFNGMWAFVLFDRRKNQVVLCRDRFGIKPLYYTIHENRLYLASEIKALLTIPGFTTQPNESIVYSFLMSGLLDHSQETFFKNIHSFPPAHFATISLERPTQMSLTRYWDFPEESFSGSEADAIDQFRSLFFDSVKIHSVSDVPIGTCLSGGLDSSSIVCAADEMGKKQEIPNLTHNSFGYCSDDASFNERSFMDEVVQATQTRMHYIQVDQEQFDRDIEAIMQLQDEPFGSASIAMQWYVFQRAKQTGMKVMLDGQGADEILGGYHYYYRYAAIDYLKSYQWLSLYRLLNEYKSHYQKWPLTGREMARLAMPSLGLQVVQKVRSIHGNSAAAENRAERIGRQYGLRREWVESALEKQSAGASFTTFHDFLRQQVAETSLPGLLRYEDRNSMAHSIESRVPFLDYRLVNLAFSLGTQQKINGIWTKHVLREAMKGILPDSIRLRKDKIGFKSSPSLTYRYIQKNRFVIQENESEFEKQWFDRETLQSLLQSQQNNIADEFLQWRILNLKVWLRTHWSNKSCAV